MPAFSVRIQRGISERMSDIRFAEYVDWIVNEAIREESIKKNWRGKKTLQAPERGLHGWVFTADLEFKKGSGSRKDEIVEQETTVIMAALLRACNHSKFTRANNSYKWRVFRDGAEVLPEEIDAASGVSDLISFERAATWEEMSIDQRLIDLTDEQIEEHPAFEGLYDRSPHIRITLGAMQRAIETGGAVRNNVLLWGPAGGAKSSLLEGIKNLIPENSWISLNVDSSTAAGFQRVFMDRLRITGTPPILFLEECDKLASGNGHILSPFLSVFDRRGMMEKNTARKSGRIRASVLCIATVNNKELFDSLLAGALTSRFTLQLHVSLPNRTTMRRILLREINTYGGDPEWADPCLDLAQELNVEDPRTIIGYLAGGTRLLTGEFQSDMKRVTLARKTLNGHTLDDEYMASLQSFKRTNGY